MKKKSTAGFTLVELIIYIAILATALGAVTTFIISGTDIISRLKAVREVRASATVSLERFMREVQGAYDIDEAASTLGTSPGSIVFLSDDGAGGVQETEFRVESGDLVLYKDGLLEGSLITDTVEVDSLIFREVTHGASVSARAELTLSTKAPLPDRVDSFYTTALLRGTY